jgi:hypothetical protein
MNNLLTTDGKGYSAQKIFLEWGIQGEGEILTTLWYNWSRRNEIADWLLQHKDEWNEESDVSLEEIILDEVTFDMSEIIIPSSTSVLADEVFDFYNLQILQKL